MNIGILPFQKEKKMTGINKVTIAVLDKMMERYAQNQYYVLECSKWNEKYSQCISIIAQDIQPTVSLNVITDAYNLDIVHSYFSAFHVNSNLKCKRILTINDVRPLEHPEWDEAWFAYFDIHLRKCANEVDDIIAISEYTKAEIIKYYGVPEQKVTVIYPGLHMNPKHVLDNMDYMYEKVGKNGFLLNVSGIDHNKNQKGLVEAFLEYKRRYPSDKCKLILTGPVRRTEAMPENLQGASKYIDDIVYVGYVSDEELQWLYEHTTAFIYPSFYEGFGLPILEAMAFGKAVICSNVTSMPEVGGDAVQYCNPYDIESMVDAIARVIRDKEYREELERRAIVQAKRFSYDKTAEETMRLYLK